MEIQPHDFDDLGLQLFVIIVLKGLGSMGLQLRRSPDSMDGHVADTLVRSQPTGAPMGVSGARH